MENNNVTTGHGVVKGILMDITPSETEDLISLTILAGGKNVVLNLVCISDFPLKVLRHSVGIGEPIEFVFDQNQDSKNIRSWRCSKEWDFGQFDGTLESFQKTETGTAVFTIVQDGVSRQFQARPNSSIATSFVSMARQGMHVSAYWVTRDGVDVLDRIETVL